MWRSIVREVKFREASVASDEVKIFLGQQDQVLNPRWSERANLNSGVVRESKFKIRRTKMADFFVPVI